MRLLGKCQKLIDKGVGRIQVDIPQAGSIVEVPLEALDDVFELLPFTITPLVGFTELSGIGQYT